MEATTEEVDIPPWLNSEYLANILSEEEHKSISVTDMNVKAAVSKGENYLSILYRIVVECNEDNGGREEKKYFLILKTLPKGEMMQKIVSDSRSFEKELHMYGSTLPAMYCAMKAGLHTLSARHLPTKMEKVIILEDLQHLGYKMANRQIGLDLEHCEMAVRALAKFHAASVAVHKSDPSCMDIYTEGFFRDTEEGRNMMSLHFGGNFQQIASLVEKWPGYEHYADRLRNKIPTAVERMLKLLQPNKDSLNVLNHGDCWVNNMMFHYSTKTGKIDDIKFLDFQLARFSSPALDLQYFLCTSSNDEVRFRYWGHLLREYHSELRHTLESLDLDTDLFTPENLKDEFEAKEEFGLMIVCTLLWAVVARSDDVPDLSQMKEGDMKNYDIESSPTQKAMSGGRYRELLQMFLQHYDSKGLV